MTSHPKKLNISEAWELYRMMGDILKVSSEEPVFHLVTRIVKSLSPTRIFDALEILYGEGYDIKPPDDIASMLVTGLSYNQMPQFYGQVNRILNHANGRLRSGRGSNS